MIAKKIAEHLQERGEPHRGMKNGDDCQNMEMEKTSGKVISNFEKCVNLYSRRASSFTGKVSP